MQNNQEIQMKKLSAGMARLSADVEQFRVWRSGFGCYQPKTLVDPRSPTLQQVRQANSQWNHTYYNFWDLTKTIKITTFDTLYVGLPNAKESHAELILSHGKTIL